MLILNARQTTDVLPWPALIDALREGFKTGCEMPARHQHDFCVPEESDGTLLLMPAWIPGKYLGVKQVMVIPDNGQRGLPAVSAGYQLASAKTGETLAVIDGGVLTNRRTAAASALASSFLSRDNANHLLMVGSGGLARNLIQAHAVARPITRVSIWGRTPQNSDQLAAEMRKLGIAAESVRDLEAAAQQAHIISCATLSDTPLIQGSWLTAGTHLDLVGAFKAGMRESDDEVMRRASIFVDTRAGALQEAGDIIQPLRDGVIADTDILADLFDLARHTHSGRKDSNEITVFKSVGTALEDLAAAVLAYENSAAAGSGNFD